MVWPIEVIAGGAAESESDSARAACDEVSTQQASNGSKYPRL